MEYLAIAVAIVVLVICFMIWKDGKEQEKREAAAKEARINEAVARGREKARHLSNVLSRDYALAGSPPKASPASNTRVNERSSHHADLYRSVNQSPRSPGRPSAFAAAYGQPHVQDTSGDILGLAVTAVIVDELLDSTPSYSYDEPTTTRYESCSTSSYSDSGYSSSSDSYSSSSYSSSSCSSDSSSW